MFPKNIGVAMPSSHNRQISSHSLFDSQQKIFSELASFQWVHVSEELPQPGQRVMLFFNEPSGKSASNILLGQLVYADADSACYLLDSGEMECDAVYWMPLPFTP